MINTIPYRSIKIIAEFKNLAKKNGGYIAVLKSPFVNPNTNENIIHGIKIQEVIDLLEKAVINPNGFFYSNYNEYIMAIKKKREEIDDEDILGSSDDDVLGEKEPSIDQLLGDSLPGLTLPATKRISTPRISNNGVMVSFIRSKDGVRINAPGVLYYVVKDPNDSKKLHYKKAEDVIFLPDDWKEGDPVPGWE